MLFILDLYYVKFITKDKKQHNCKHSSTRNALRKINK